MSSIFIEGKSFSEKKSDDESHHWLESSLKWERTELSSPRTEIRTLAVTWNMKGQECPDDISDILLLSAPHHLYIISVQECLRPIAFSIFYSSKREWEEKVLVTLGKDYYLINSGTLGATNLMLIVHNSILDIISDVFVDTVATGIFNLIPNKGGIGISFKLGNKSMLVIGCHLASGEDSVTERVEDFLSIEERLELGDRSKKYASDRFDSTIYLGDMNFRINGKKDNVRALIDLNERFALLKQDELRFQILSGNLPLRYKEGDIGFPPTYKLKGQNYVSNRIPSWTDRILYKDKTGSLIQESYGSIISNIYSDHKPVYSQFTIII